MKYLILVGTGGFARELLWLAREINRASENPGHRDPLYRILGFVSEEMEEAREYGGLPILGDDAWVFEHLERNVLFVPAVGDPHLRRKIAEKYMEEGFRPATLVHPSVHMAEDVQIGQGSLVCAGANITTNIVLGDYAVVNLNATLGHDVKVGAYSTIHPGAHLNGNVQTGEQVEVGSGAVLLPGVHVGNNGIVGAGSVVTKDVPAETTVVGNPARPMKA